MDQFLIFSAEKGHVEGEKDPDRSAGKRHGQAEKNGVPCDSPLIGVREELAEIEKPHTFVGPEGQKNGPGEGHNNVAQNEESHDPVPEQAEGGDAADFLFHSLPSFDKTEVFI